MENSSPNPLFHCDIRFKTNSAGLNPSPKNSFAKTVHIVRHLPEYLEAEPKENTLSFSKKFHPIRNAGVFSFGCEIEAWRAIHSRSKVQRMI